MPKIPTFTAQARPTAEVGGVKSNVQVPTPNFVGGIQNALTDYYVKEKTAEANTNALQILGDLYGDQKDGTKGLYSIQDELKHNGNPSQVPGLYDEKVKQLWESAKTTKLDSLDNFTRKALEQKFQATSLLFKQEVVKGSRDTLYNNQKTVVGEDTQRDIINLKTIGPDYLSIFNQNRIDAISKIADVQDWQKKELISGAIQFGHKELAQTLIDKNQPELFNQLIKSGKLKLDSKSFGDLTDKANKKIKENTFNFLSDELDVVAGTSTPMTIQDSYNQAKSGTFNGNVDKINLFEKLTKGEKEEFFINLNKKKRESNAEVNSVNSAIMNNARVEEINKSLNVYKNMQNNNGIISKLAINEIFGDVKDNTFLQNSKQQFIDLSTRQGNGELKKISNYYKNNEITNKILNGEIKDLSTPFLLSKETKAKSILQRTGDGVNMEVDLKFYTNYLLPNANNKQFSDDQKDFFKFINKYSPAVEGVKYARYLDITADNRLNKFKNDMLQKFIAGRNKNISSVDLLDYKGDNFIGKNLVSYIGNPKEIEQSLNEALKNNMTMKEAFGKEQITLPLRLKNESIQDYKKRIGR